MPRSGRVLLIALSTMWGCTCGEDVRRQPVLVAVVPPSGVEGIAVPIVITGEAFAPVVFVSHRRGEETRFDFTFLGTLGIAALLDVEFVDGQTLTAVVPATLPPGDYDLTIVDPAGMDTTLSPAFTVTALCVVGLEQCDNGTDDDCDGLTDCADVFDCGVGATCGPGGAACDAAGLCVCPGTVETCDDGVDNDCDGLADCEDVVDCPQATACGSNGLQCDALAQCSCSTGASETSCTDGLDNDCDGFTDAVDISCAIGWTDLAFPDTGKNPDIAVDSAGNPAVVWETVGKDIYYLEWDGSAWIEQNASASGAGVSAEPINDSKKPAIAFDGADRPVLVWEQKVGVDARLYLRRWDGSTWSEQGGSSSGSGLATTQKARKPAIAIAPNGNIVVAWESDSAGEERVYLRLWDGSNWQGLGGSDSDFGLEASGERARHPTVAVDATGDIYVVWDHKLGVATNIRLRYWDGAAWLDLASSGAGGGLSGTSDALRPTLVLDDLGRPVVAWEEGIGPFLEIYLRHWTGSAWAELSASATGGGVSRTAAKSDDASLAFYGITPVLLWRDELSGNSQVFVGAHEGSWVEMGTGSMNGAGVSAAPAGVGGRPKVACAVGVCFATWSASGTIFVSRIP